MSESAEKKIAAGSRSKIGEPSTSKNYDALSHTLCYDDELKNELSSQSTRNLVEKAIGNSQRSDHRRAKL